MKYYFYDSIYRGFGNVIYTVYGPVAISIFGNGQDTLIGFVAYDAESSIINSLDESEKSDRIIFSKEYDISDINFYDEFTVYEKLHFIISDLEKTLY